MTIQVTWYADCKKYTWPCKIMIVVFLQVHHSVAKKTRLLIGYNFSGPSKLAFIILLVFKIEYTIYCSETSGFRPIAAFILAQESVFSVWLSISIKKFMLWKTFCLDKLSLYLPLNKVRKRRKALEPSLLFKVGENKSIFIFFDFWLLNWKMAIFYSMLFFRSKSNSSELQTKNFEISTSLKIAM